MEYTAYIFFYLLGIPLWLVPPILIARSKAEAPASKGRWVMFALVSPILIIAVGALALTLLTQKFGVSTVWAGNFGLFSFGVNLLGFFAPVCLLYLFRKKYCKR